MCQFLNTQQKIISKFIYIVNITSITFVITLVYKQFIVKLLVILAFSFNFFFFLVGSHDLSHSHEEAKGG